MSTSPEYDTIDLPAGQTIAITQPLEIDPLGRHRRQRRDARLRSGEHGRLAGLGAPAPSTSATRAARTSRSELDDFTIRFDMSQPIRWSNPAGTSPSLWDPENNPGITHAVIDTQDSNSNENRDVITLERHDDLRPARVRRLELFRPPGRRSAQSGDTGHEYVGRAGHRPGADQRRGQRDDHRQHLPGGPDRGLRRAVDHHRQHVLGATADTYSPAAFELHSPFDAVIEGNHGDPERPRRPGVPPGGPGRSRATNDTIQGQHRSGAGPARSATR